MEAMKIIELNETILHGPVRGSERNHHYDETKQNEQITSVHGASPGTRV